MILEPLHHQNNLPPVHGQLSALKAVSLKFIQPVYLAKTKSLVFCYRSALGSLSDSNYFSFRVNYDRTIMIESAVPTFGNFEELATVIEKSLGKAAGALVRQGAMPLLQGEGPATLPSPKLKSSRSWLRSARRRSSI